MAENINKTEIINKIKEHKIAIKNLCKSYGKISNEDNKDNKNNENNLIKKKINIYHKIYNKTYYPIITGFDSNLNDKYFPLLYNSTISPLFNDDNVYKKQSGETIIHGNVLISLSGNNHNYIDDDGNEIIGDFKLADQKAKSIELFTNDRPNGYVWHHVFMGWFDSSCYPLINDGMSIDNFLSEYREPYYYQYTSNPYIFESQQPFNYYDKKVSNVRTLDASNWINCLTLMENDLYWTPDSNSTLSLMQLVKKELILGSEYLDSTDQYVIYKDNIEGGYQGDYTEDDHDKFSNSQPVNQ
ncbi:MAG: hypothetical protein Pg6B_04610 [Candidatus Azobacteroides pseudotrichonymphae]|uniref:Uncharacterized protein n=1 Tax=Candidatus Improbicoccus pseudotrichonymphae TaxID=3033792 RepID=A0AA48IAR8_9FIRM|nr:MAG: hypothetical protein CfP315_0618 [Candidatus Improbicoccus pseudotrichonymphae]GMO34206.1 MAG: hypothetical protein Pg6B_04610 [Candidatus Azobacteroides pseudotrichonymphae]